MAGIMNKIGDALHIGGNKDEDNKKKHEAECAPAADHKKHESSSEHKEGEKKEGIADKIKDKIHGGEKDGGEKCGEGEKKKKKDKKKKKEGHHDGGHDSSSSSDSD